MRVSEKHAIKSVEKNLHTTKTVVPQNRRAPPGAQKSLHRTKQTRRTLTVAPRKQNGTARPTLTAAPRKQNAHNPSQRKIASQHTNRRTALKPSHRKEKETYAPLAHEPSHCTRTREPPHAETEWCCEERARTSHRARTVAARTNIVSRSNIAAPR